VRVCLQGEDCLCAAYRLVGEHVPGGLAEYVKVPAANVRRLPDHVSYEEAAAFMLTNMTAWRIQLHIVGSTMANRAQFGTVVRLLFEGRPD
jgi:NADPH:quinone reductase-like Zn-dependent oxidoreductase